MERLEDHGAAGKAIQEAFVLAAQAISLTPHRDGDDFGPPHHHPTQTRETLIRIGQRKQLGSRLQGASEGNIVVRDGLVGFRWLALEYKSILIREQPRHS